LSSAVLYLAIVAIWVGVLVPRWLRRSHPAATQQPVGQPDETLASAEHHSDSRPGWSAEPGRSADLAGQDDRLPGDTQFAAAPTYLDADEAADVMAAGYEETGPAWSAPPAPPSPAGRPSGRAHVIQARRRMLTMLMTVAVAAVACTAAHLTRWWVCIPVAGMIGFYLVLLRAAAIADAENRELRAEALQLRGYDQRARARQARPVPQPTPVADIIDISAMVSDQLYDQYADDTARAVGD
jgi:hypothetical protein